MRSLRRLALIIPIALGVAMAAGEAAADATRALGVWQGALEVPGARLRLAVRVARDSTGALAATLDSIDQHARGVKIDTIRVDGNALTFQINAIGARFAGDFSASQDEIVGTWTQSAARLPLTLRRDADVPVLRRPQDPEHPLPYREEEVFYDSAPGVRLAAALTLPEGAGPFPAVVLISGSGPHDRDGRMFGHRPFAVMADALTRRGIAVLRTDERGVRRSTGNFGAATSEDFAQDALAGVRYLLQRSEIDGRRIGLIGHSEGGMVAPLAAVRDTPEARQVAFLVLIAGPSVPLLDILREQQKLILRAEGVPEPLVEANGRVARQLIDIVRAVPDSGRAAVEMRAVFTAYAAQVPEHVRAQLSAITEPQIALLTSPWMRWMLHYDPAPTLRQLKIPVLALYGAKDLQVPPAQNREPARSALEANGHAATQVQVLPDLNHLFQTARRGSPSEYAQIEETFSPAALGLIADWVLALP